MCETDSRGQRRRTAEGQSQWGVTGLVLEDTVGSRGAQRETVRGRGESTLVWEARPGGKQRARQNGTEEEKGLKICM